jgi:MFS family permease
MSVAQIVMYLTVARIDTPVFAVIAVAAWGISQGCFAPLTSAALPRLFGRRHLGEIAGAQMSPALVIGSAIGPCVRAVRRDLVQSVAGSYEVALCLWECSMVVPGERDMVLHTGWFGRLPPTRSARPIRSSTPRLLTPSTLRTPCSSRCSTASHRCLRSGR